jgi:hypothetical protein
VEKGDVRNKTRNTAQAVGRYDGRTAKLMAAIQHGIESDQRFLAMLPERFTAKQAQKAWGYRNVDNATRRIDLLEAAGFIELAGLRIPARSRGYGSRSTLGIWRKTSLTETQLP